MKISKLLENLNPNMYSYLSGRLNCVARFNLTMGTNDAIDTAFAFPDATIIPVHFEGWPHYTETGEMLQQSFAALGISNRPKLLKPGIKTEL